MGVQKNLLRISLFASFLALTACATTQKTSKESAKSEIYLAAGNDALNAGNFTQALSALLEAVRYAPKNPEAWNSLGLSYLGKQQYDKAEESWKKALEVDPKWSTSRTSLGGLYLELNRLPEAEKHLKLAIGDLTFTGSYLAHYNLGVVYIKMHRQLQAEQEFKIATSENNTYCPAWYQLGMIQKERSNYEEAAASLKNALKGICFNQPGVHYEIASLYLRDRKPALAKSKLLEVIELFPRSDWAKKAEISLNQMR